MSTYVSDQHFWPNKIRQSGYNSCIDIEVEVSLQISDYTLDRVLQTASSSLSSSKKLMQVGGLFKSFF